jgi:hypothetical protein
MRPYKDGTVYAAGFTDQHAHDAMVAHALLQSIDTHLRIYTGKSRMDLMEVKLRANEIMAGWGYSDDGYSADIRIADIGEDRGIK